MVPDPEDLESLLEHDTDIEDIEEEIYLDEETSTEEIKPLRYNEWAAVANCEIELLTDFMETIETVGFYNQWEDWYKEGVSPRDAAILGLIL